MRNAVHAMIGAVWSHPRDDTRLEPRLSQQHGSSPAAAHRTAVNVPYASRQPRPPAGGERSGGATATAGAAHALACGSASSSFLSSKTRSRNSTMRPGIQMFIDSVSDVAWIEASAVAHHTPQTGSARSQHKGLVTLFVGAARRGGPLPHAPLGARRWCAERTHRVRCPPTCVWWNHIGGT